MSIRRSIKTIFLILFLLIILIFPILNVFYSRSINERMHPIAVLQYKISAFFGYKIPTPQFAVFIELPRESLLIKEPSAQSTRTIKPPTRFKVGEEIFFRPVLINLTPKPVTISIAGGYFSINIQDEGGRSIPIRIYDREGRLIYKYPYGIKEIIRGSFYFTLRSGERITTGFLKPWGEGEPSGWREYIGWDPAKYPVEEGGFKLVFDQPGRYQITAYASFNPADMMSFKLKDHTLLEEWQIHAIPVWIEVFD